MSRRNKKTTLAPRAEEVAKAPAAAGSASSEDEELRSLDSVPDLIPTMKSMEDRLSTHETTLERILQAMARLEARLDSVSPALATLTPTKAPKVLTPARESSAKINSSPSEMESPGTNSVARSTPSSADKLRMTLGLPARNETTASVNHFPQVITAALVPFDLKEITQKNVLSWFHRATILEQQMPGFPHGQSLSDRTVEKIVLAYENLACDSAPKDVSKMFPAKPFWISHAEARNLPLEALHKCLLFAIKGTLQLPEERLYEELNSIEPKDKSHNSLEFLSKRAREILNNHPDSNMLPAVNTNAMRILKRKLTSAMPDAYEHKWLVLMNQGEQDFDEDNNPTKVPKAMLFLLNRLLQFYDTNAANAKVSSPEKKSHEKIKEKDRKGKKEETRKNKASVADLRGIAVKDLQLEHFKSICFDCGSLKHRTNHADCKHTKNAEPTAKAKDLKARWSELKKSATPVKSVASLVPTTSNNTSSAPTATTPQVHSVAALIPYPNNFVESTFENLPLAEWTTEEEIPLLVPINNTPLAVSAIDPPGNDPDSDIVDGIDQPVSINGHTVIATIDACAKGGNWISRSVAINCGLKIQKCEEQRFVSPIAADAPRTYNECVETEIFFNDWEFSVPITMLRVMEDSNFIGTPKILLGARFVNQHDLLTHIVHSREMKVEIPAPAPEETLGQGCNTFYATPAATLSVSAIEPDWISQIVATDFPLRNEAIQLIKEFDNIVFVDELVNSTITNIPEMDIPLISPFYGVPPRRMSAAKESFLKQWLDKMEKNAIIRRSSATATSPLHLVPKPGAQFRVTQDVSELNKHLATLPGFLPVTREKIQKVGGHAFYFSFDLINAYFQFKVSDPLCKLYAFSTPFGNYEWCNVLPQGDKNAPAWVNTQLAIIFKELQSLELYFDDAVGYADTPEDMLKELELFLMTCKTHNVKLARKKCTVGATTIKAFGFTFNAEGYEPLNEQREKFLNAPFPTRDTLKCWFGLLNVFRDFIPNLHKIEEPFTQVRKKNAAWGITQAMKDAFDNARKSVANIKILHFPIPGRPLYLDTDANDTGCGSILYQLDEHGNRIVIRFLSHIFSLVAKKMANNRKGMLQHYPCTTLPRTHAVGPPFHNPN